MGKQPELPLDNSQERPPRANAVPRRLRRGHLRHERQFRCRLGRQFLVQERRDLPDRRYLLVEGVDGDQDSEALLDDLTKAEQRERVHSELEQVAVDREFVGRVTRESTDHFTKLGEYPEVPRRRPRRHSSPALTPPNPT